jgi:sorbitol-specific phosphotransferase system component IIA
VPVLGRGEVEVSFPGKVEVSFPGKVEESFPGKVEVSGTVCKRVCKRSLFHELDPRNKGLA